MLFEGMLSWRIVKLTLKSSSYIKNSQQPFTEPGAFCKATPDYQYYYCSLSPTPMPSHIVYQRQYSYINKYIYTIEHPTLRYVHTLFPYIIGNKKSHTYIEQMGVFVAEHAYLCRNTYRITQCRFTQTKNIIQSQMSLAMLIILYVILLILPEYKCKYGCIGMCLCIPMLYTNYILEQRHYSKEENAYTFDHYFMQSFGADKQLG